jgi:murein DD-endopeptidase MepM/ murein hydrolase activator NlpD
MNPGGPVDFWRWPLATPDGEPPAILRPFEPPAKRWLSGHRGVDLAAPAAATVVAAGPGTVSFAAVLFGQPIVVVDHGGLRTSYEPVEPLVHTGQSVAAGTPLGTLRPGHCPDRSCLHWGLLTGNGHAVRYYDPLILLGLSHLRLEPAP